MDMYGASGQQQPSNGPNMMDLGGAFGGNNGGEQAQSATSMNTSKQSGGFDLLDDMGGFGGENSSQQTNKKLDLTAFDDGAITVKFVCTKVA